MWYDSKHSIVKAGTTENEYETLSMMLFDKQIVLPNDRSMKISYLKDERQDDSRIKTLMALEKAARLQSSEDEYSVIFVKKAYNTTTLRDDTMNELQNGKLGILKELSEKYQGTMACLKHPTKENAVIVLYANSTIIHMFARVINTVIAYFGGTCVEETINSKALLEQKYKDVADQYRKTTVAKYVKDVLTARKNEITSSINNIEDGIKRMIAKINNDSRLLSERRSQLLLFEMDEGVGTNIEAFEKAKAIKEIEYDERTRNLNITIKTPLNNHSPEDLRMIVRSSTNGFTKEIKALLKAVFLQDKYLLHCTTRITISSSGSITPILEPVETCTFATNPHITFFGCFGSYGTAINTCFVLGDIERAITTLISSCANMNWQDSIVRNRMIIMLTNLIERDEECFECVETGEMITAAEILKLDSDT